ncbi:MAG: type VI secretion protein ImpB [Pseudomonadota bacterium]
MRHQTTGIFVNYLFLDMNSYFASVAQQEEPYLQGRPVGIVTVDKPGACCIAASYEAKRLGIGVGTRKAEARELCPDIEFREAKHDLYVDYHHQIRTAMEQVHPVEKAHSVDEFAIKLLGTARRLETAISIAEAMRSSITTQVGEAMRCSIGLGSSKLLAKMAGEMKKPDGLEWLTPEVMPDKLRNFELSALPGIGKRMEKRLINAGITDIGELYKLQPKHGRKLWNSVNGERFILALHGHDIPDPVTSPHSLGHGQILSSGNRTANGARLVARRLLIKAATRLRRGMFFTNHLYLSCKDVEGNKRSISQTIPATQDTFDLLHHFSQLWPELSVEKPGSVGVMLGGLTDQNQHTADLFETRPGSGLSTGREKLCAAVDALNQRYGQDTIIYGEKPKEITPYTGAKIAFGRIPGREEFRD